MTLQDKPTPDEAEFEAAFASAAGPQPAADDAAQTLVETPSTPAEGAARSAAATTDTQAGADNSAPAAAPAAPTIEQLQAELQEARHRERSSANRISTFARQADAAQREAEELRRKLQPPEPAAATKPQPTKPEANADDVLAQAPELQAAVQRRLSAAMEPMQAALDAANARLRELGEATQTVSRQVEPLVSRETERERLTVERRLDEAFGAWRDTIRGGDFKAWLSRQPETVQTLYANGSTYDEAAVVLKLFKTDQPAAAGAAQPAANTAAGTATQSQTERLRQAVGVRSTSVPRPAPKADDFEGAFNEFASQRTKR